MLVRDAIVALLQGNSQLIQLLQNADWIGVSVISQIEFLAFSGLSQDDRQLFQLVSSASGVVLNSDKPYQT